MREAAPLAQRWPVYLLAVAVLLTVVAAIGLPRARIDASAGLLADTGSAAFADQARFADAFGADPVVVLVEPPKGQQLLTPDRLVGLAQLEGDLSRMRGVRRVYGPGTLVNTFASEVTRRALDLCGAEGQQAEAQAVSAAQKAGKNATDQTAAGQQAFDAAVRGCAQRLAAQYPTLGVPALNNPAFYQELLLEPNGAVRPFWKAVLPDTGHALISVRMSRDASLADVEAVIDHVRTATSGPASHLVTTGGQQVSAPTTAGELAGTRFTISGTPAVAADLAEAVRRSLTVLVPLVVLVMLVISGLVLRVRLRLLAVPLALLAGVWTAGACGLLGIPLTPATLAVLPVVLGLTTDYVLQALNLLAETPGQPRTALAAIAPATGVAAAATVAGVLAFAISPVPLVRQFAFAMTIGIVCAWLASLLVWPPLTWRPLAARASRAVSGRVPSWGALVRVGRLPRVVVVPLAIAGLAGWAALPMLRLETDPSRLLPPGAPSLQAAAHVRQATGYVGELDLVVAGPDVSSPAVVAWLAGAEGRVASGDLSPITGLPQLLTTFNYGQPPDAATTKVILDRMPAYLTQAVATPDRHLAEVTLGVSRVTSVDEDRSLAARASAAVGQPPAGYRAYPAGLAVLAASALDRLQADRVRLTLLAVGLVLAVLLLVYRRPAPALLAVLPTVAAAGWVTGLLWLAGARETPVMVLLAGVVVAFATEFGVLWLARYRSELASGAAPDAAADVASRRVGPAVVTSALALAAGFAALAVSPVPMVREFGLWCAGDLALATLAVLALLPPAARAWIR